MKPSDAFRPPFFRFPTPSDPLFRPASDRFRPPSDHPALCRAARWGAGCPARMSPQAASGSPRFVKRETS